MDKNTAQNAIKKLQSEVVSLSPSSLIILFEIDIGFLADERQIQINESERIFRFHNNTKLITTDIYWQGNKYILAPIAAEGFELNARGTLPVPKLTMSVNSQGVPALALLKNEIKVFGDLIGAKITRRRTFAKYLDTLTFPNGNIPPDFEPDPNVEFPPDIYYVNRKTRENKYIIEYELNSILDLEGVQIPRRPIIARTCPFAYRGEGCMYEYSERRNDDIHGDDQTSILPLSAPPVATDEDTRISELLGDVPITVMGQYVPGNTYNKGQAVFLNFAGVNYYFVANQNGVTANPLDIRFWIQDKCSKKISGCKLRWGINGSVNTTNTSLKKGELPFGGFPSTERIVRQ